MQQAKMQKAFD